MVSTDGLLRERDDAHSHAFGPYELYPGRQLLLRGGARVALGGRAFDILTLLVQRAGDVVSKRQLMAHVWPDVVVDDCNLKVNMATLRRALDGDGAEGGAAIATVTGRGYRFVAAVHTRGAPRLGPPPSVAALRTHNLPARSTRVVGREAAVDALHRDLDASRLVSIVGAGGLGKTTVALAVATRAEAAFADGVWHVDLTALTEAAALPDAIGAAVGLTGAAAASLASLCQAVRDRRMLVLLDGCDHLIDAVAFAVDLLLNATTEVKVLATSREPLMVPGERVRRLPPLDSPPPSHKLTADEAVAYSAVQLFVARATDGNDTFQLDDADAPRLARLCRGLDGLPLAIELAAARVATFGMPGLLRHLDERPLELLSGRRAGPARHRTLAATLDWSFDLLPLHDAALLQAVALFAARFDVAGATHMTGLSHAETEEGLVRLTAKSLLGNTIHPCGVTYRMPNTVRSACAERLRVQGQHDTLHRRHAEWVCAQLQRAGAAKGQPMAARCADELEPLLDELRSALEWASRVDDAALARSLSHAGSLLWQCAGEHGAGRHAAGASAGTVAESFVPGPAAPALPMMAAAALAERAAAGLVRTEVSAC